MPNLNNVYKTHREKLLRVRPFTVGGENDFIIEQLQFVTIKIL